MIQGNLTGIDQIQKVSFASVNWKVSFAAAVGLIFHLHQPLKRGLHKLDR